MNDKLKQESEFAKMGMQVLNNEAYKIALMARKTQIFEVFCNTKADQTDVREEAWRTMANLTALEQYFEQLLTTGKMADQMLKED